ncbi:MAG TPA: 5-(carboxyamino)imidazole ribonucleotide mutase, partial [Solirubrobacterales bacterium]|nr:5-(carboxyamino)imidazole ribonucleotide mutase [Solirubrobacterales bacterium]
MSEETQQPATLSSVEELFEEIDVEQPQVGIIMGSKNDKPKMQPAGQALEDAGIAYEVRVMSAHRDPVLVAEYCTNAKMRGLKVIIAGAGMSAALPGVAAAH